MLWLYNCVSVWLGAREHISLSRQETLCDKECTHMDALVWEGNLCVLLCESSMYLLPPFLPIFSFPHSIVEQAASSPKVCEKRYISDQVVVC
jgi:hypothetical protein